MALHSIGTHLSKTSQPSLDIIAIGEYLSLHHMALLKHGEITLVYHFSWGRSRVKMLKCSLLLGNLTIFFLATESIIIENIFDVPFLR